MRLEDKVALITGGASGMGASMARIFAREGARVVIADRMADEGARLAAEIVAANGAALFQPLDVTNETEWRVAIDRTLAEFGGSTSSSTMPESAAAPKRICTTPPPGRASWRSTRPAPFSA
jgi:NAD(P)-dependent dehydrogenase (short-subunit alcohol dehydrogenase family)